MANEAWLAALQQHSAIAVIRSPSLTIGASMAQAVAAGGIRLVEVTWKSDRPTELIHHLRQVLPQCWIGAGTLMTVDEMKAAIAAGAQFLFSPHTNAALIQTAIAHSIPVIPGALSPSEIVQAWQLGASSVKVFPVQAMGGADYIRSLQGPLGQIPLIPTGGVTLDNATSMLEAGAIAVGLSGQLFPPDAIAAEAWDRITQQAQTLIARFHSHPSHPHL
jgi:2-dehydro-3-deoxyphosphogluconate aldolase/(4S)-4-hydroxy-2-oxoglutarate aldolase